MELITDCENSSFQSFEKDNLKRNSGYQSDVECETLCTVIPALKTALVEVIYRDSAVGINNASVLYDLQGKAFIVSQ